MIIIGGAYHEVCTRPNDRRLRGSGMRAAIVLRRVEPKVQLITAVSADEQAELSAVTAAFGLDVMPVSRDVPVIFSYYTPLSPPAIDGLEARISDPIAATATSVLRFGLIEDVDDVSIDCETLVLDPQGDTASLPTGGSKYKRLAIVANEREVRRLARLADTDAAAQEVRDRFGADVAVVKCGALGSIVAEARGNERVGPSPTPLVRPIGSGDAFSAAFAHAYGDLGADSVEAAREASRFTGAFVSSPSEPHFHEADLVAAVPYGTRDQIYLAGPFFGLGQEWLVDVVRQALHELGALPFSPAHDVGSGGPEVAKADLDGLDASAAVLALLDGYDPGTVFEIGYAIRSGKPVVGYLDPAQTDHLTMFQGTGVEIVSDLSTAVYHTIWSGMAASG